MSQGVRVVGNGPQFWVREEQAHIMVRSGAYAWSGTRRRKIKYIKENSRLRDFSAHHGEYLTVHKREPWAKLILSEIHGTVERAFPQGVRDGVEPARGK